MIRTWRWAPLALFFSLVLGAVAFFARKSQQQSAVSEANTSPNNAASLLAPNGAGTLSMEGGMAPNSSPTSSPASAGERKATSPAASLTGLSEEDANWPSTQWFVAPPFVAPGQYPNVPTKFSFTKSCDSQKEELEKKDLGNTLHTTHGIDATTQFPNRLRIETLSQFYTLNGRYFQVSMNTTGAVPPVYELSLVASSHPQFQGDVATLPVPGLAEGSVLDAPSALAAVSRLLQQAKDQGALEGARTMSVQSHAPNGDVLVAEVQNGRIVGYFQPGLNCLYARSDNSLKCVCGF